MKNISIQRKRQRRFGDFVYTETLGFQQPLTPGIVRNLHLSQADVNEILEETDKGIAVRTALSYWLKGVNSQIDILSLIDIGKHLTVFCCIKEIQHENVREFKQ